MRIGEPEAYTVEGIVFWVRSEYDPRRLHDDTMRAKRQKPDAKPEAVDEAALAIEQSAVDMLAATVERIENLVGTDGEPITEWSPELRRLLPEPVTDELMNRVYTYLSDDRQGEAQSEPESPPPTTSPD